MADVLADPQLAHRRMLVTMRDDRGGEYTVPGNPIKISGFADSRIRAPLAALNADSARIRAQL